ncbi:MAG TPA: phosphodiester glycosidase family protein [Longimicrobiales bacterium]|nr:phosphodiester glycosidase family protein [Longimicrobiales bacterium]
MRRPAAAAEEPDLIRRTEGRGAPAPRPALRAAALAASLLVPAAPLPGQQLPSTGLAVRVDGAWRTWWRAAEAPARWRAPDRMVTRAVRWHAARPGLESARLDLSGDGVAWRVAVLLVCLDPRRFDLRLAEATRDDDTRGAWTVDSLPAGAALALNAGQFDAGRPWGWLVRDARELQPPGVGPLSSAFVVDTSGAARLVPPDSIPRLRGDPAVRQAFQSYPTLLTGDGEIPEPLRAESRGVDLRHRDSRLGACELRDGRILFALTRFAGLGEALAQLPFGPTTPEMAAVMGALGCRRAVLLDGGLSGQLALRRARGDVVRWDGLRAVPLALVAFPRSR